MAIINSCISSFSKFIMQNQQFVGTGFQQIRNQWCKSKTLRDMKRRTIAKNYAVDRLRLLGIKRNDILPRELCEDACNQFDERIPRASALRQLTNRCVVTSKPRGMVYRWRVSRHIFRHLSDYNKLAGIQRAMW